MKFLFLPTILILIWVLKHNIKRHTKYEKKSNADFWANESKANDTRKANIDNLDYIVIPFNSLPFNISKDKDIEEIEQSIKELEGKKILNLTGTTNTQLKLQYGPANLDILTQCDENYTTLVRLICNWGRKLKDAGYLSEAITVLEYGISINTDISSNYILLANIYKNSMETYKIESLREKAQGLNSLSKAAIIEKLDNIMAD